MTIELSRRYAAALFGFAASTVAVTTAADGASFVADDTELLALGEKWKNLNARAVIADIEQGNRESETKFPDPPEALFEKPEDDEFNLTRFLHERHDGRMWYWPRLDPDDSSLEASVWRIKHYQGRDDAHARLTEIREAAIAHKAAMEAAYEFSGARAASNIVLALSSEAEGLRKRILAIPARTLAGVLLKARISAACHAEYDASDFRPTDQGFAHAVVFDLLALHGATPPQIEGKECYSSPVDRSA